ncbi:hypothetical protein H7F51_11495 [Novosphingobium flavum]|uniref:SMP-30/Gluconolactonase/LRE-like region domain-containing protein n=1 Tax=Novosphingobium flavum TaxID=1778672 RepID=A0A7X1FTN0_9SPHN|nr:hypothetical protein [Novosphingobium flavum]MBC2666142.1 hypothetical protein [Novosphingobium flavum]
MPSWIARASRAAFLLAGALLTEPVQASPPPAESQPAACAAEGELAYLCGAQKPEDVIAIPGTRWLIASGFAPGAGLKLVDGPARRLSRWYTGAAGQIAPDQAAWPACPAPPDPALLNDRGLSLRPLGPGRWRLLVVNHGGREAVEVFDVSATGTAPRITWRGCLPMPPGQVGNSVTGLPDGEVLVTVLTRPGTTIADFVAGKITGAVWSWRPGDATFRPLPGTELPGNNGIESSPDGREFYVVAFGLHAVVVYARADTSRPLRTIVAPDFMPDNIHWTGGHLLIAGMRLDEPACGGLRPIVGGVADPMLCHRGWVVGEVDLAAGRISTFAYGTPRAAFNGLSAAALSGPDLWLGSFQADRLAVTAPPKTAPEQGQP